MKRLALRVLKFIGAIFLLWVLGTLIHAWHLGRKGVICCDPRPR